jgi:voltage-gated potassium channel
MSSTQSESAKKPEKTGALQLLNLGLSIYVIAALCYETFFEVDPEIGRLLDKIDYLVCAFFFYDFCQRFYRAESKLRFMRWGWIDLLSSIPALPMSGSARLYRVIRILRMLRGFRSTKTLVQYLYLKRSRGVMGTVVVIVVLLLIISSIAILSFEKAPDSNIRTSGDALWWAASTITTVGYGDRYPVTSEGRIIAVLLMATGVVLFGTFTGFVTSFLTEEEGEENVRAIQTLTEEVRLMRQKLDSLEKIAHQSTDVNSKAA